MDVALLKSIQLIKKIILQAAYHVAKSISQSTCIGSPMTSELVLIPIVVCLWMNRDWGTSF